MAAARPGRPTEPAASENRAVGQAADPSVQPALHDGSAAESAPLFSVVVPTYDRPDLLREAVQSVLQQTVTDLECIVVDDCSPRPPRLPADPRIRLLVQPRNSGVAAARNRGIEAARGRYIAFLDDDDAWLPERLGGCLAYLETAPVVLCRRTDWTGRERRRERWEGDVSDTILDGMTPHLGQTLVRRDVVQFFDEQWVASQDVDWWLRTSRSTPVCTAPVVGLRYRKHSGIRHGNGVRARIAASERLLDRHAEYFAAHPRAAAFRWKRIGLMAETVGESARARRAYLRSIRLHPSPRTAWHLVRLLTP